MHTDAFRIGHGYDVHRLIKGRPLFLGGIAIPHEKGLLGHSNADVLLHAVMDALLGAMGCDDIGTLFPDSDPQYCGVRSATLCTKIMQMLLENGWHVGNVDITVIAQQPKLSPYKKEMRTSIASLLQCAPDVVNIKATTEEGLGFTGRCEGIAAHAVAMIIKQNGV